MQQHAHALRISYSAAIRMRGDYGGLVRGKTDFADQFLRTPGQWRFVRRRADGRHDYDELYM